MITLVGTDGLLLDSSACATVFNPSLWGILVYNADTSIVTSIELGLTFLLVSIFLRKAPVSFRYDGNFSASGCKWWSIYRARFEVGLSIAAIIGLPGFDGLCTFGSM